MSSVHDHSAHGWASLETAMAEPGPTDPFLAGHVATGHDGVQAGGAPRKTSLAGGGIKVAASKAATIPDAVAEVSASIGTSGHSQLLVFFAASYDADEMAAALAAAFPGVEVSGCTTSGEIMPCGMVEGGMLVMAFPEDGFRFHAEIIGDPGTIGMDQASAIVRRLKSKLLRPEAGGEPTAFAILLADGLSNAEEALTASIHWAIDGIELIGGSAGDSLAFRRTSLIHAGRTHRNAALLLLVETDRPFKVFKTQNFEPTSTKLVVTAADPANRVVHELNAEPAAREYAAAIGLLPNDLGPFSFASYPLVVKVGGDYYCRSIRNMNDDGSLTFFCAIDEGLVFTVARPQDLVTSAEETLREVASSLGEIESVLGFDCILRRLDAESRQIRMLLEGLYQRYNVVGFHTYGEQYNGMHLNQTLTGIAFGPKRTHQ